MSNQRNETRSVSFSSRPAEVYHIDYPDDLENYDLWFTLEEKGQMDQRMLRDVMRCSRVLSDTSINLQDPMVFEEHLIQCTGLDRLVSRDVPGRFRAIRREKQEHVHRVLLAQNRLRNISDVLEEDISHTSEISSRRARYRSYMVAALAASIIRT